MRYIAYAVAAALALSSPFLDAQNLDPARICAPVLTHAVTERYLESNRSFQKKILSQLCSEQELTAEKARNQGLEINAVIEGTPVGALWSDNASERQNARSKLCTMDFSDVSDVSYIKLMERVPLPDLMAEYNRCVGLTTTSSTPMMCSLSENDPEFSTLHITYYPKTSVTPPLVTSATVHGGIVSGGRAEADYLYNVALWRDGASKSRPVFPASDQLLAPNTEIKVGSTFITVHRGNGNPLRIEVNNSHNLPCQAFSPATDAVALDVTITPHGNNSTIEQAVKQLRAADGCSADGSVTHERKYCVDERGALENVSINVLSAGSPKDASYIEKTERVGNCATVYYHLRGAGLDWLRFCKGSAWLDADITLHQRVPVGDVIAFPSQQTSMKAASLTPGCSVHVPFSKPLPSGVILKSWTWKADITSVEREIDQYGIPSMMRKSYQISDASSSSGKFSGEWIGSVTSGSSLVITRSGGKCGETESVSAHPQDKTPTLAQRAQQRTEQVTNSGSGRFDIPASESSELKRIDGSPRMKDLQKLDAPGKMIRTR